MLYHGWLFPEQLSTALTTNSLTRIEMQSILQVLFDRTHTPQRQNAPWVRRVSRFNIIEASPANTAP